MRIIIIVFPTSGSLRFVMELGGGGRPYFFVYNNMFAITTITAIVRSGISITKIIHNPIGVLTRARLRRWSGVREGGGGGGGSGGVYKMAEFMSYNLYSGLARTTITGFLRAAAVAHCNIITRRHRVTLKRPVRSTYTYIILHIIHLYDIYNMLLFITTIGYDYHYMIILCSAAHPAFVFAFGRFMRFSTASRRNTLWAAVYINGLGCILYIIYSCT